MLDDRADAALAVAHDASVTRHLVETDGQHRESALTGPRHQPLERRRADQRHIAVQNQHRVIIGDDGHGLHHGMARTQLLGLQYPVDVFVMQRRLHLRTAVPINDADVVGIERAGGADHMLQQRLPGQRLQDFGHVRVHPLALPRGEYDDGKRHDNSFGSALARTIHELRKSSKEAGSDRYFPEREKQGSAHAPSGFARDGEPRLAAMQDCIASQVFPAAPRKGSRRSGKYLSDPASMHENIFRS